MQSSPASLLFALQHLQQLSPQLLASLQPPAATAAQLPHWLQPHPPPCLDGAHLLSQPSEVAYPGCNLQQLLVHSAQWRWRQWQRQAVNAAIQLVTAVLQQHNMRISDSGWHQQLEIRHVNLNRQFRDAQNKPVWRENTCPAQP